MGRSLCALMVLLALAAGALGCGQTPSSTQEQDTPAPSKSARHTSEAAIVRAEEYDSALESKTVEVAPEQAALHTVAEPRAASSRYTVMVFMTGSNLESQYAAATSDLEEMLSSGADPSRVNVVVYAGGSKRWNADIPTGKNSVLDLSRTEGDRIVAQTDSDASMGAPETLAAFVNYCSEHYPAEHNALVFWDHGGGPLWGYGYDELNDGDSLLLQELQQAMEKTPYAADGQKRLDWVGFDACLMGSMENASLWKDYAGWLVASEEVEPGAGWDYSFLSALNDTDDPALIGRAAVESYAAYYERAAGSFSNPDVTLACLNLSEAGAAAGALDALLERMTVSVGEGGYGDLNRARRSSKTFGLTGVDGRSAGYDLVDVADFATQLEPLYPQEATTLRESVGRLVASSSANVERASGVSLYVPGDNRELYEAYGRLDALAENGRAAPGGAGGAAAPGASIMGPTYDRFVEAFAGEWASTSDVDWTLGPVESGENGLSLQLTDEQREATLSATYTVMRGSEVEPSKDLALCDVSTSIDDNGRLHIPADPQLITVKTDIGDEIWSHFNQMESGDGSASYSSNNLRLLAAGDFGDAGYGDRDVSVSVQMGDGDHVVTVQSVSANDDAVGASGKSTIDVSRYSHLNQPQHSVEPKYDSNGDVLPWDEWEVSTYGGSNRPIEQGFRFSSQPASYFGGQWCCQVVVTDVNGRRHALEPKSLPISSDGPIDDEKITRETDLGELTFRIVDDHAELTRYEGEDWTVDIPTEVEGMPVTAIGNHAFSGCKYLDELVIPDGITTIGQSAFAQTGVYSLSLPSTLAHVSPAAFREMKHLEGFSITGQNEAVSVKDGVLFSADGSTLIAYPASKSAEYVVPQGTRIIGYGAFAGSDVSNVTLPDGLEIIDRAAFYECENLGAVRLPVSLREIGALAFGTSNRTDRMLANVESILIGPNVTHIGAHAFRGLKLAGIEVDPGNPLYSSKNGALLNRVGDTLLEIPRGDTSVVVIPEGVARVDGGVLSDLDKSTDFVLPASVAHCDSDSFPSSSTSNDDGTQGREYSCTIHSPPDSYASRFAEGSGIAHDTETDPSRISHDRVILEQGGHSMLFWVYFDHAAFMAVSNTRNDEDQYDRRIVDHSLSIPNEIAGVPVTTVDLGRVSVVEGERDDNYSIESLTLPNTVSSMGRKGLEQLSNLKYIAIEDSNPYYKVVDNTMLSIDGRELVRCPYREDGPYEIPDGVVSIGRKAFEGCSGITEITIPSSVESIGESAFSRCENLEHVNFGRGIEVVEDSAFSGCEKLVMDAPLPNTLVSIGSSAFSGIGSYEGLEIPSGIERIGIGAFGTSSLHENELRHVNVGLVEIGQYLETIGRRAFASLDISGFEVDDENSAYRSDGPFLLTKDGTAIVSFADGYGGDARIPDGVKTIDNAVFATAHKLTDLYIPESVTNITWPTTESLDSNLYGNARIKTIEVHVKPGSYAERFAVERGLPWTVE